MNTKDKSQHKLTFHQRIKEFYLEESYALVTKFNRSFLLSIFLVIFKHFQYFLLQITPSIASKLQIISENSDFLQGSNYFQSNKTFEIAFLYLFLFLNSFIFIGFSFYFIRSIIWQLKPKENNILSLAFQIYYYAFYLISLLCSILLLNQYQIASIINFVLTIIITFIKVFHEYDDRFVRQDFLSIRNLWQRTICCSLELVLPIAYVYSKDNQLLITIIIFYLIILSLELFYIPIYKQEVQVLNICGFVYNLLATINAYLMLNTNFWRIYFLNLLIFIPLSFLFAKNMVKMRIRQICQEQLYKNNIKMEFNGNQSKQLQQHNIYSQRDLDSLDIYLRSIYEICKLSYDDYLSSYSSLYLEYIIQNHQKYCQQYPYCFCAEDIIDQEQRESTELRSKFLYHYIEQIYWQAIQVNSHQSQSNLLFSYLMFVIEVQKNETKAITIALDYLQNKKNVMGMHQQQRLFFIIGFLNQKVKIFNIQFQLQNKNKEINLDFIESINFDSNMYKSCLLFQQCFLLKKIALQRMGKNMIDLEQIYQILKLLRQKREELQLILSLLIDLYHDSFILQQIIEIYHKSLQFDDYLQDKLNKEKKFMNATLASHLLLQKKKLSLYSEDSCVIFITLLQNIGTIKKVTNNVFDVIPIYKVNELIGKNINYMMAQQISLVHDDILRNFIKYRNMNFKVKNYSLIIGIDSNGWAIPYEMKIQTCMIELNDFGVSCWIKQIKDSNQYIQMSYSNNFEVFTLSQSFFKLFLQNCVPKSNLHQVKMGSLIPTLESFLKKNYSNTNTLYETLIFKPKSEQFCYTNSNFVKDNNLVINIFEQQMFKIKADFQIIRHSSIDFVQMKILSLEQLEEQRAKFEAVSQLLMDFQSFQMYDTDFIDCQRLVLQNYLIKINKNNKFLQMKDCYLIESQNDQEELSESASVENKQYSVKDNDQYQQISLGYTSNIQEEKRQICYELNEIPTKVLSHKQQKSIKLDEDKTQSFINQKQKTKSPTKDLEVKQLSSKFDGSILFLQNESYIDLCSPQSNSQMQMIFNAATGNDLLNSPKNANISNISQIQQSYQQFFKNKRLSSKDSILYPERLKSQSKNDYFDSKQATFIEYNLQKSTSSINLTKTETKKNSNKNMSKLKTKISQNKLNQSSIKLSDKNTEQKKKQKLIQDIRNPNKMTILRLIQYFGFLTLLLMVILNVVSFLSLNTYLQNQKDDYENYDWANRMQVVLTQILGTEAIQNIISINPLYLQSNENSNVMIKDIFVQQQEQLNLTSRLLLTYQDNKVQSTLSDIIQNKIYNLTFAYNVTHQIQVPLNLDYALKNIFAYLFYIVNNYQSTQIAQKVYILQLQQNMIKLNQQLDNVDDLIYDAIHQTFSNIQNSITSSQIADLIVASFFSISFIPIYMYVQKKRQDVLILFSTFGPDKIQIMTDNLIECELQIEVLKKQLNNNNSDQEKDTLNKQQKSKDNENQNFKLQSDLIEKKKNISSTTKLPIFKYSLILYLSLFILVNIVYPFGIGLALNSFIETQLNNLEYTNEIYKIHLYTSKLNAYRMQTIWTKLLGQNTVNKIYLSENNALIQNSTQQLNNFYSIINKQSDLSRFDYDSFNSLNTNLMQGDACLVSSNNIGYITSKGFNIEVCNKTDNGIFNQGLINSVKYFCEEISYTNPLFQESNITIYKQNLLKHFKQFSLTNYYYYLVYESYIVEIIRGFVKDLTLNEYNMYTKINISLIITQIFAFIISIILIQTGFFNQCYNSIYDTKRLLDLIEIQCLRENQYFVSYFRSLK
ncbi:transmembrane protein, putative (macronuclear) [Tetrahymena thermophila SB210]|uniref:Transmembrane protein, putative n=1 Tax=Tetrahymena thermophila (strain SB210) TaxID=312017 RepID=I7LT70_TETTS|nr:transmembrane protein, putative [Tetrahymena thermophila SB210]EAR84600.3 transmembrane protein, putative [Tetrahymena thermophila SB210]|eukprot:XP_001032263.3 transmembrane protein, putative [Tetrahymena thermophila SB210]